MMNYPLTIFTTCKPFVDDIALFQSLAIESWRALGIAVMIIGNEEGTEQIARQHGCHYIANVKTSSEGIPYVNSLFELAVSHTSSKYLCYVNADILLDEHFKAALESFFNSNFKEEFQFMTARRRTVPFVDVPETFVDAKVRLDWLNKNYAVWDKPDAIDMFLFSRDLYTDIPSFEIGRMEWDNWLLNYACDQDCALIDGTEIFHLLHPFHGYPGGLNDILAGTANQKNKKLSPGQGKDIQTARNYVFEGQTIQRCSSFKSDDFDSQYSLDQKQELRAFLFFLTNVATQLSDLQIWEYVRQFLWRAEFYFPFNESASRMDFLRDKIKNNELSVDINCDSKIYGVLQDCVNEKLTALLCTLKASSRHLVIWGTGQLSIRLTNWLMEKDICVYCYVDTYALTDIHLAQKLHRPDYLVRQNDKPFVLIASIFYNEIKQQLNKLGYSENQDFSY